LFAISSISASFLFLLECSTSVLNSIYNTARFAAIDEVSIFFENCNLIRAGEQSFSLCCGIAVEQNYKVSNGPVIGDSDIWTLL